MNENSNKYSIKNQKIITLTQLRQNELERLTNELAKPFDNNGEEKVNQIVSRLTQASIYLTTFFNQKGYLFPILYEQIHLKQHENLGVLISQIILSVEKNHGKMIDKTENSKMEKLFIEYHNLKADLVHSLQVYIVKELE